mmetsp:Transcript_23333/g.69312  ORF Transcript_23333/g.69312 Transcript_23333/m.69312 type:complete len:298 (+) Transcript_23333:442-1335(+)
MKRRAIDDVVADRMVVGEQVLATRLNLGALVVVHLPKLLARWRLVVAERQDVVVLCARVARSAAAIAALGCEQRFVRLKLLVLALPARTVAVVHVRALCLVQLLLPLLHLLSLLVRNRRVVALETRLLVRVSRAPRQRADGVVDHRHSFLAHAHLLQRGAAGAHGVAVVAAQRLDVTEGRQLAGVLLPRVLCVLRGHARVVSIAVAHGMDGRCHASGLCLDRLVSVLVHLLLHPRVMLCVELHRGVVITVHRDRTAATAWRGKRRERPENARRVWHQRPRRGCGGWVQKRRGWEGLP